MTAAADHIQIACDTEAGERVTADCRVLRRVLLGCGCIRVEAERPGGGRVHVLTGCTGEVEYAWRKVGGPHDDVHHIPHGHEPVRRSDWERVERHVGPWRPVDD